MLRPRFQKGDRVKPTDYIVFPELKPGTTGTVVGYSRNESGLMNQLRVRIDGQRKIKKSHVDWWMPIGEAVVTRADVERAVERLFEIGGTDAKADLLVQHKTRRDGYRTVTSECFRPADVVRKLCMELGV
jgi:hypothetical protein